MGSEMCIRDRNLGDGSFGAKQIIDDDLAQVHCVHAADLDGDGDADVVASGYNDGTIVVYENQGDASFSSAQVISTSFVPSTELTTVDIDGDDDLDILITERSGGRIIIYENFGDGTFAEENDVGFIFYLSSTDAADFDGDGTIDVVGAYGEMAYFQNLGNGAFGEQQVITWGSNDTGATWSLRASDIDGLSLIHI